jgi:hypothetical protein
MADILQASPYTPREKNKPRWIEGREREGWPRGSELIEREIALHTSVGLQGLISQEAPKALIY